MVRQLKSQVLTQLPPIQRSKVPLQLRPSELKVVERQMQRVRDFEDEAAGGGDELPAKELMAIFRLLADAKVPAVREWLESTLLDPDGDFGTDRKALIFCHHRSVHAQLADCLRAKLRDDEWIQVHGGTAEADRATRLAAFQRAPRTRFALLGLTACGVGLNLAMADTVVFAELCWSPATLAQAEARVHRIGQQASKVAIHYLCAAEPDQRMFGALVRKSRAARRVVDGETGPHDDLGAVRESSTVARRRTAEEGAESAEDARGGGDVSRRRLDFAGRKVACDGAAAAARDDAGAAAASSAADASPPASRPPSSRPSCASAVSPSRACSRRASCSS
eukprot:5769603-Prymnesium_polylepis.1